MMGAVFPANPWAPRAAENAGSRVVIAAGALVAALGASGLVIVHHHVPYWAICVQLAAIGAGLGLLVPPLTSSLLGSVEKSRSGVAAGVLNATRQTGSVPGVALFGSLISHGGDFIAGARLAAIIAAALLLVTAVAIVPPASCRPPDEKDTRQT
jgi:MFS transporter, DHA2 family, methylenomycin A resistance protein